MPQKELKVSNGNAYSLTNILMMSVLYNHHIDCVPYYSGQVCWDIFEYKILFVRGLQNNKDNCNCLMGIKRAAAMIFIALYAYQFVS